MELKELKAKYSVLEKKYSLPNFEKLSSDFEVDKIDKDSDNILRNIRKVLMEKIINSLNFLEMLQSGVNAPRIYLPYLKNMSAEDKNIIDAIYSEISKLSLDSISLEIDCFEKDEAEMIKRVYLVWQEQKPHFRKIISNIKKPVISASKREKSYFG